MKKTFPILLLLSVFLAGCNVNRSMTDITQSKRVKYKLRPEPNNETPEYYTYAAPGFTKANSIKYRKLTTTLDSINKRLSRSSDKAQEYFENSSSILQNQISQIPKDSTYNYIVSFTDNMKGINYSVVRTYWWDYSNWRFMIPFLGYFNRWHNFNQCVNRGMAKCLKYNCDGVIIAGDYSTFKLFVVK